MAAVADKDLLETAGRDALETLGATEARALAEDAAAAVNIAASSELRAGAESAAAASLRANASVSQTVRAQSFKDAATTVKNAKTDLESANPASRSAQEEAEIGAAASRQEGGASLVQKKFGISGTTLLCGAVAAAFVAYSLIMWKATDGKSITITNIKPLGNGTIQVTYTPPSQTFLLRVQDTLDFSGCNGSECINLGAGERVTGLIDGNNCVVTPNETLTFPSPTPSPSGPTPSGTASSTGAPLGSWGTATVHSTFSSQFIGSVADVTATAVGAAAGAVAAGVDAAAPGVRNVLDTGGNLASGVFCDMVPFLCDSTTLWIIGGICLCIIIMAVVFFVLKK
jgi:hypothetical protein